MLTRNYKEFRRIASQTQKGFWKQQALTKINKELSHGKMKFLPMKNTIQKFTFGSKYKERVPYKGNLFPSISVIHNKQRVKKSNSCDKSRNNINKDVFMTQVNKGMNDEQTKKDNEQSIRQRWLSIQLQLKEDVKFNQITLIPFIVKRRAIRRKEDVRFGRVHLTEDNIFKEFITKAFWKKGALTERTNCTNNNTSDYYTSNNNNSNITQSLNNMNMNEMINTYKQRCFSSTINSNNSNSIGIQTHLKSNSNNVYKKKRHLTIFN